MIFADATKTEVARLCFTPFLRQLNQKVASAEPLRQLRGVSLSSTTHLRSGRLQNRGRVRGENDLLTCSVNQFRGPYESFQEEFFSPLFSRQRTLRDVHRSPSFGSIFPTETEGEELWICCRLGRGKELNSLRPL